MTIIAISQEMGSCGYAIAATVAKALNYDYVDRQMIVDAAEADVLEAAIAEVADRRLSAWQRFNEEKIRYRALLDAAFFGFAEKDNVVTAGRRLAALVQGVSHAVRVRVIAPFEVRVERIMKHDHLDHGKAVHKIWEYDRDITARISSLFGPEWLLPESYDLMINTVRDEPALYADMVTAFASYPRFVATPASTQLVRNLSLAARVRAVLARNLHTRSGVRLEVTADNGHVTLKGSIRHVSVQDALLTAVKDVPGVLSVSCEAVGVSRFHLPAT